VLRYFFITISPFHFIFALIRHAYYFSFAPSMPLMPLATPITPSPSISRRRLIDVSLISPLLLFHTPLF